MQNEYLILSEKKSLSISYLQCLLDCSWPCLKDDRLAFLYEATDKMFALDAVKCACMHALMHTQEQL